MLEIRLFGQQSLSDRIQARVKKMREEILAEDQNQLLNVNEAEYVKYLVERHAFDPLVLHWDNLRISDSEQLVRGDFFPRDFDVHPGRSYSKQVITYHLPYSGDSVLVQCRPDLSPDLSYQVYTEDECICFEFVNFRDDPADITRQSTPVFNNVRNLWTRLDSQVQKFNDNLETTVRQLVQARKADFLKRSNLLSALGIPLKSNPNAPTTFLLPITKKQLIIKPSAPSTAYAPEPTMDDAIYQAILNMLHQWGVVMECHPSLYTGKSEEALREHFLMVLTPHFDSAVGEAFNKEGKTDILVRHEMKNAFIAECKFWSGIKGFYDTIDQCLKYLTWRDSKAAIICFVRNKEMNPVLQLIENETTKHPCCVKALGKRPEGWYDVSVTRSASLQSHHKRHTIYDMTFMMPLVVVQATALWPKLRV